MKLTSCPAEGLLLLAIAFYTFWAPYTKVEESFNLHAIHDMLEFGVTPAAIKHYDHIAFPGVVPRTFIGALIVSALSYVPYQAISTLTGKHLDGLHKQILVRLVLGICNGSALICLSRKISKTHGTGTKYFFLAFQATQFHVMYYASRTLPNMFALPFTVIATTCLIDADADIYRGIFLLTLSTILFRAEILVLLITTVSWHLTVTRRLAFYRTIKVGIVAGLVSLGLSFAMDSYFWGFYVVPELSGFYFNAIQGNSSDWGTSPVYQYLIDLPKLLLNPAVFLSLLPLSFVMNSEARNVIIPAVGFVGLYSAQPHKEWRFIIYVIPQLTFAASLAASHIFLHRSKNILYKLLTWGMLASIPVTGLISLMMLLISGMNYPGGEAMKSISTLNGGPVYLDVSTCMTGSTKFLQSGRQFSRTENETELASLEFWDSLAFASVSDPESINRVYAEGKQSSGWSTVDTIFAYDGIDLTNRRIRKSPKLTIMQNDRKR